MSLSSLFKMGKIKINEREEVISKESRTRMITLRRDGEGIIETSRDKRKLEEGIEYHLKPGTYLYGLKDAEMKSQEQ